MKFNEFLYSILSQSKEIILDMRKITIARGDGIGPEIMDATLRIMMAKMHIL